MSYDDLAGHAAEIKELAISKTVDMGIQATAASGAAPPIGMLQDMAEGTFADTGSIFDEWIGLPDPDLLDGGIDNIAAALSFLSAESYLTHADAKEFAGGGGTSFNISGIEPTAAFMQGWQSGTAISYAQFASLFGPVTANLSMCAGVLRGAYEAEHAIWREARASVDELAHATIAALEKCLDKNPDDVALTLTVLGAVSSIVAVPFTAGGSLVAAYSFAAIGAATSLGGAFAPEDEEWKSTISGDTPREIVSSLMDKLTKLNEDIAAKETAVGEALTLTIGDFRSALALPPGESPVKMPRPTVADNPSFGGHD